MRNFDIYVAYVEWDTGGKKRPVLVYRIEQDTAWVFPITTQYDNKPQYFKDFYFEIIDWEEAGLHQKSYADTNNSYTYNVSSFLSRKFVGQLSQRDKLRLIKFMSE